MFSENLRLHEAIEKLDAKDLPVQAALAAAQANWHASRSAWPEAARAFDRLVAADPAEPAAWLRHTGIIAAGDGALHQDRPADGARLLREGARRRRQDGLPAIASGVGVDDPLGPLFVPLRAEAEKRLAQAPNDIRLLELRAEIAAHANDFAAQAASYSAILKIVGATQPRKQPRACGNYVIAAAATPSSG